MHLGIPSTSCESNTRDPSLHLPQFLSKWFISCQVEYVGDLLYLVWMWAKTEVNVGSIFAASSMGFWEWRENDISQD